MQHQRRYILASVVFVLFALLVVLPTSAQEPTDTEVLQERVWIPFVMGNDNRMGSSFSDISTSDAWPTYYSSELNITFAYPPNWRIEPPLVIEELTLPEEALINDTLVFDIPEEGTYSVEGYVVSILPPDPHSDNIGKIEMTIQSYEIEEGQSLLEWQTEMNILLNLSIPERGEIVDLVDLTSEELLNATGADQILHGRTIVDSVGAVSQTVWLAKGRLVYIINTLVNSSEMENILKQVASSIQFDAQLPESLNALYGTNLERPTIEDSINRFLESEPPAECDIVCRDVKEAEQLGINPDPIPTATPDSTPSEQLTNSVQSASTDAMLLGTQKALPPYWEAPVYVTTNVNVECGSTFHTGPAEFALDISVGIGTNVHSSTGGSVLTRGWDNTGYGNTIVIATLFSMADENREYRHRYAHLNDFVIGAQVLSVQSRQLIAHSGNTGGVPAHLHFHISTNNMPVDASPVFGFTPNLSYPSVFATCGLIRPRSLSPLIIEAVAFYIRQQPRQNDYWFCYTGGHTNECYMRAVPNDGTNYTVGGSQTSPNSPRLAYVIPRPNLNSAFYRIWVCGQGGSTSDDSLHMGRDDVTTPDSINITGFSGSSWVWRSERVGGAVPYLYLSPTGQTYVDVWMYEDGMRFNRIVLTPSTSSTAPNIRCGSY